MKYKQIEVYDLVKPKNNVALPESIRSDEYAQVIAIDTVKQRYICRFHTGKVLCLPETALNKATLVKWRIDKPYTFIRLLSNNAVKITLRKYVQGLDDNAKEFYEWWHQTINWSQLAKNKSDSVVKENKEDVSLSTLHELLVKTLEKIETLTKIIASPEEVDNK